MRQLSLAGQQAVNDIAQRQGFSTNAVESMLESVINGNGSMAQFNHPEFGGGGQWMSGGMTMIGDMFNGNLKSRVDNLCSELARLISNQPDLVRSGSFQSQSQNGSTQYTGSNGSNSANTSNGSGDGNGLFTPAPPDWWGSDLRFPNSTGGQNDMRYAYFAQARRLAIDVGGQVTVYDTLDHSIGGVSQQSGGYGPQLSSQYGYVNLSQLPVVTINGMAPMAPPAFRNNDNSYSSFNSTAGSGKGSDVFASIEKMADLQAKGILTSQEFATKKAELLSRL
ncbi:MAG: SHOCT domain-containing protein [Ferruginibacter sp.]|nr:SHOCT domain-containing protein [Rhodoferax sp.]